MFSRGIIFSDKMNQIKVSEPFISPRHTKNFGVEMHVFFTVKCRKKIMPAQIYKSTEGHPRGIYYSRNCHTRRILKFVLISLNLDHFLDCFPYFISFFYLKDLTPRSNVELNKRRTKLPLSRSKRVKLDRRVKRRL